MAGCAGSVIRGVSVHVDLVSTVFHSQATKHVGSIFGFHVVRIGGVKNKGERVFFFAHESVSICCALLEERTFLVDACKICSCSPCAGRSEHLLVAVGRISAP